MSDTPDPAAAKMNDDLGSDSNDGLDEELERSYSDLQDEMKEADEQGEPAGDKPAGDKPREQRRKDKKPLKDSVESQESS